MKRFLLLLSLILVVLVPLPAKVSANYTVNFLIKDGQGDPITNPLVLRFSLWDAYEVRSEDIDGSGNINTAAKHYGGYETVVTIDNGGEGSFSVISYDTDKLPGFPDPLGPTNSFLQLEYKGIGDPDTSYQVYDFINDPPWQNITRKLMVDKISYVTYDAGPRSNYNTFTLDANNNAPTEIKLEFGETLMEYLQWDIANARFELSDDLVVDGNIEQNGNTFIVDADNTGGDITMQFGTTLSETIKWDSTNSEFNISDDLNVAGGLAVGANVDLNLNQLVEARAEILSTPPACNTSSRGRFFYNDPDDLIYFCNGTNWLSL